MSKYRFDPIFLFISVLLIIFGLLVFFSASFGLLARTGASFSSVAFGQIVLGLIGGGIAAFIAYKIPLQTVARYSPYILALSAVAMLLVFVPGIGLEHGGAKRWILLGPISFQPAELLKLSLVMALAYWYSLVRDKISTFKFGAIPLLILLSVAAILLLLQPDTGTFIIIALALVSIFIVAGGPIKHIALIALLGLICMSVLIFAKPYIRQRVQTFIDPHRDPYGSSYQIQQSLLAIGSGGTLGRGFGQSIQKFNYLPEPIGDSIFAVLGEEFGFLGSMLLVVLFTSFALRGLRIAARAHSIFGRLLAVGVVIIVISQSFLNMMAILGLIPLTGEPLAFVSHGGTALLFSILSVGLLLNVSANTTARNSVA